jgi:hypothetical protein
VVDREHAQAIAGPLEQWRFDNVRRDYQALLASQRDAPAREAVQKRLDRVAQEDETATAARKFEAALETSRKRDAEIEQIREALRTLRSAESLAYDAGGSFRRPRSEFRARSSSPSSTTRGSSRLI